MKWQQSRIYLVYLLVGACGGVLAATAFQRRTWPDLIVGVLLLLLVVAASPPSIKLISGLFPKRVDPALIKSAPVVIYWRPLCPYCANLGDRLGKDRRKAVWVNIWRDPAGAEMVRGLNAGNELVPTVIIDGVAHPNPDLAVVRSALATITG